MNILVLEDDASLRGILARELADRGHAVTAAAGWAQVPAESVGAFDAALLDLKLAHESGLDALERLRAANPACRAVLMTGYGSHATALEAGRLGAVHYLNKPVSMPWLLWALALGPKPAEADPEAGPATLARQESEYIAYVLQQCGGNLSQAARLLGLRRQSLQRKLKKYNTP
jgi:two-component system response regulator RegA